MILIINCPAHSQAQIQQNLQPDFGCLTRDQKERVVTCFEQLEGCHEGLEEINSELTDHSGIVITAIIGFLVGGIVGVSVH